MQGNGLIYNTFLFYSTNILTMEDAGEWKCELESYHAGRYRGYGYVREGTMMVDVLQGE